MQSTQQPSWKTTAKKRGRARLARDLRRAAIVIALLALTLTLVFLLFPPFFAPETHVVLIGSNGNVAFNAPPIPFVREDLDSLGSIEEAEIHDCSDTLRSAQSASLLGNRLAETGVSGRDNLIVYVNAHGIADDGSAYLLCDNFDLRQPDLGRISIASFIDQVRATPAANKLILINAGTIDYDPGLGVIGNEFPKQLEEVVRKTNDDSLWVLCSHSEFQYSHASRAARHSVFGMFLGEGLKGAADLDHDQSIRLSELVGFTSANVTKWVDQSTDRGARQVPKLIWGGRGSRRPDPNLITLFEQDPNQALTVASLLAPSEETIGGAGSSPTRRKVRGLIRRNEVTLASNRMASASSDDPGNTGTNDAGGESSDQAAAGVAAADTPSEEATEEDAGTTGSPGNPSATPGQEAASDGGGPQNGKSSSEASRKANQLLSNAWRSRDTAAVSWSPFDPSISPVENQPHLWRELQAELLAFEQQLNGGQGFDSGQIESTLENSFAPKPASATAGRKTPPLESLFRTKSLDNIPAMRAIEREQSHSLALAELAATISGTEWTIDSDQLRATLDRNTRDAFDEWLKTRWRPEFAGYVEMATIRRLADAQDLDWDLMRVAILTVLNGERAAALDLLSPGWIRTEVERGDQLRLFAEELVFDRVGLQWQTRCRELFEDAATIYQNAESEFVEVRRAERLIEVLVARTPSYLRWHRMSSFIPDRRAAIFQDLSTLLDRSTELSDLLNQPGESEIETLSSIRIELESLQAQIEATCGDDSAARLLEHSPTAGDSYRAELLLSTPLLNSSTRRDLLAARERRDRQLAANYDLANITVDDAMLIAERVALPTQEDWRLLFEQALLESRFVNFSRVNGPASDQLPAAIAARQVEKALTNLRQAYAATEALDARSDASETDGSPANPAELWKQHSEFGDALQSFYRSATELESALSPCAVSASTSRLAIRLLRMLDARDAWQLAQVDVNAFSLSTRIRSTLLWQAERFEQASTYAQSDSDLSEAFSDWVDDYRARADSICRSSVAQTLELDLRVTGPDQADLQYSDTDDLILGIDNPNDRDVTITISLEFEDRLVDVITDAVNGTHSEDAPEDMIRPIFFDTPSQFGTRRSEPITIPAQDSIAFPIKLVRKDNASESTKLVVDAYAKSDLSRSTAIPPVLLGRQTLDVQLPVAEVFIRQGSATFVSDVDGVELLPYPNRLESFRFGVINHASRTKQISVRCLALQSNLDAALSDDPGVFLASALPLAAFELTVPGDGRPAFPGPGEGEQSGEEESKREQQDDAADQEDAADEPIKSTDMPHGMLIAMTDRDTGQTTYRKLRFSVQRPRRFVTPRVGFDTKKQQITIEVAADPNRLPTGAPVRVEARLADDSLGRTEGKLQGAISRSNPITNLFIKTTSLPPSLAKVQIDVDGYPRAFLFHVPTGKQLTNIPEVTDRVDLRMATSSKNGILAATQSIPVAVQIDAPVGSFENGRDHLDIGIDLDGSGVPRPEDSVRLSTDRGVQIGFVKSAPDGTVELTNVVSDHLIDLPAERLENLSIDVAASLTVNGHVQSVRNIELLIDTAAPIVGPITRTDGLDFSAINTPIAFDVWAWDEQSDVTKVEAAFDVEGSGEFPPAGETFTASRAEDRRWVLEVNSGAETGKRTLLVRGVDTVGNESEPFPIDLEIVSAAENTTRVKQQTVELVGAIQLREKNVPDAEVSLIAIPEDSPEAPPPADAAAEPPPPLATVRSDNGGNYVIPGVSPGNYRLAARAVIRNRVHRTEKEVVVTVGPERKMRVDVTLP